VRGIAATRRVVSFLWRRHRCISRRRFRCHNVAKHRQELGVPGAQFPGLAPERFCFALNLGDFGLDLQAFLLQLGREPQILQFSLPELSEQRRVDSHTQLRIEQRALVPEEG
jgi:hypothetical protein